MSDIENRMVLPHADDDVQFLSEREADLLDRIEELEAELGRSEVDVDVWRSLYEDCAKNRDDVLQLLDQTLDMHADTTARLRDSIKMVDELTAALNRYVRPQA